MTSGARFHRGDVVLLPISFVSGVGMKVRPAVVVQNDILNVRLNSTVVAIITSTNARSEIEPDCQAGAIIDWLGKHPCRNVPDCGFKQASDSSRLAVFSLPSWQFLDFEPGLKIGAK